MGDEDNIRCRECGVAMVWFDEGIPRKQGFQWVYTSYWRCPNCKDEVVIFVFASINPKGRTGL
jgi:uncharacterized protein with PIN domain